MRSIGGVLVTLFASIDVVVVSSTSLAVEQQPSNGIIMKDQDITTEPDTDENPPTVGIRNFEPICPSNNNSKGGGGDGDNTLEHRGCAVREMLVSAMESDDQLRGKMRACVCTRNHTTKKGQQKICQMRS